MVFLTDINELLTKIDLGGDKIRRLVQGGEKNFFFEIATAFDRS